MGGAFANSNIMAFRPLSKLLVASALVAFTFSNAFGDWGFCRWKVFKPSVQSSEVAVRHLQQSRSVAPTVVASMEQTLNAAKILRAHLASPGFKSSIAQAHLQEHVKGGVEFWLTSFDEVSIALARANERQRGTLIAQIELISHVIQSKILANFESNGSVSSQNLDPLIQGLVSYVSVGNKDRGLINQVDIKKIKANEFDKSWAREKLRVLTTGSGRVVDLIGRAAVFRGRKDNLLAGLDGKYDQAIGMDYIVEQGTLGHDIRQLALFGFAHHQIRRTKSLAVIKSFLAQAKQSLDEQIALAEQIDLAARRGQVYVFNNEKEAAAHTIQIYTGGRLEPRPLLLGVQSAAGTSFQSVGALNAAYPALTQKSLREALERQKILKDIARQFDEKSGSGSLSEVEFLAFAVQISISLTPEMSRRARQLEDENFDDGFMSLVLRGGNSGLWTDTNELIQQLNLRGPVGANPHATYTPDKWGAFRSVLGLMRSAEGILALDEQPMGVVAVMLSGYNYVNLGGLIANPVEADDQIWLAINYFYHDLKFHVELVQEARSNMIYSGIDPERFAEAFFTELTSISDREKLARVQLAFHIAFHDFKISSGLIDNKGDALKFRSLNDVVNGRSGAYAIGSKEQTEDSRRLAFTIIRRFLRSSGYGLSHGRLLPESARGLSDSFIDTYSNQNSHEFTAARAVLDRAFLELRPLLENALDASRGAVPRNNPQVESWLSRALE